MVGTIITIESINNFFDKVILMPELSDEPITMTVDKLNGDYVGKRVSIYTTISNISNSNYGHVYPEGTIGT